MNSCVEALTVELQTEVQRKYKQQNTDQGYVQTPMIALTCRQGDVPLKVERAFFPFPQPIIEHFCNRQMENQPLQIFDKAVTPDGHGLA